MFDDPIDLEAGITTIVIQFEVYSLSNSWYYAIPILIIMGIGLAYYFRKNTTPKKGGKISKWLSRWKQ
jgi:hypothetical protein